MGIVLHISRALNFKVFCCVLSSLSSISLYYRIMSTNNYIQELCRLPSFGDFWREVVRPHDLARAGFYYWSKFPRSYAVCILRIGFVQFGSKGRFNVRATSTQTYLPFGRGEECNNIALSPPVQKRGQDECDLRNNQSVSRLSTSAASKESTRILQSCIRESRAKFLKQQCQNLQRLNRRNRLSGSTLSPFNKRNTSSSPSALSSPSSNSEGRNVPTPLSTSQREDASAQLSDAEESSSIEAHLNLTIIKPTSRQERQTLREPQTDTPRLGEPQPGTSWQEKLRRAHCVSEKLSRAHLVRKNYSQTCRVKRTKFFPINLRVKNFNF